MNITKENNVYCDVLKIELATTDTSTGYRPSDCMYMKPVAAYLQPHDSPQGLLGEDQ